jgi:DNA invertase Pin-like site-specific DNA recombinase
MSSDTQSSLSDQIECCRSYAITDVGSGMDVSKLRSHSTMLNLAGYFGSHLVVMDMSRLGRCVEIFKAVDRLVGMGVNIHSVQDCLVVERKSPYSIVKAYNLICSAIEFSNTLSNKIKTSLALKKKRGVFVGRNVPYGFKIQTIETLGVSERFLSKDPQTFDAAKKLAKTTRKNVKRPEGMSIAMLKQHRIKFRSFVKMTKITETKLNEN